jgi:hypothetical protein
MLIDNTVADVDSLEATRDGVPLPLTRTEFRLLAELASGADGAICSRERLKATQLPLKVAEQLYQTGGPGVLRAPPPLGAGSAAPSRLGRRES